MGTRTFDILWISGEMVKRVGAKGWRGFSVGGFSPSSFIVAVGEVVGASSPLLPFGSISFFPLTVKSTKSHVKLQFNTFLHAHTTLSHPFVPCTIFGDLKSISIANLDFSCFFPSPCVDVILRMTPPADNPNLSYVGLSTSSRRIPSQIEKMGSIPRRPSESMRMLEVGDLRYAWKKFPVRISRSFMWTLE